PSYGRGRRGTRCKACTVSASVNHHAVAERQARNRANRGLEQVLLHPLPVAKQIDAVLPDGPAERCAIDVPAELGLLHSTFVQEEVIGVESFVAVRVVSRAVRGVLAAIGNELHLRGRGAPAAVGGIIRGGGAELGKRRLGGAQHTGKRVTRNRVVAVNPVQRDVALVAARAIDRATAAIIVGDAAVAPRGVGLRGDKSHAWLQAEQRGGIQIQRRQVADFISGQRHADTGVGSVHRRRGSLDLDGFGYRAYLKSEIQGGGDADG